MKNIIDFFFPKICIHCKEISKKNPFFCNRCLEDFELLEKEDIKKIIDIKIVSTFDRIGPLNTFFLEIKKEKNLSLIRLAASFMVYQYLNLKYPMPDVLYPLYISKRYRFIKILTKEVSKIFKRPISKKILKDKKGIVITDLLEEKEIKQFFFSKDLIVLTLFQ